MFCCFFTCQLIALLSKREWKSVSSMLYPSIVVLFNCKMMKYSFFLVFMSGYVVVWLLCDGCMAISGLTNEKGGGRKEERENKLKIYSQKPAYDLIF